jgi:hypothetical protein
MRTLWLGLVLLVIAGGVKAQDFCIALMETDQQLDSLCGGGGHPLADGTILEIMQDRNPPGIGPEDSLAVVCSTPPNCEDGPMGTVNLNSFMMNSQDTGLWPGQFLLADWYFCSHGGLPNPNRFYVRICLPGRHYYSNIFTPTIGPSEYELGPWVCDNSPCMNCIPPQIPLNVGAGAACGGVSIYWSFTYAARTDSFLIRRNGIRVGTVAAGGQPGGRSFYYANSDTSLAEYRVSGWSAVCGEGTPSESVYARAIVPPVQVQGVLASDGLCDSTVITWNDQSAETGYRVWRSRADGSEVMQLAYLGANVLSYHDLNSQIGVVYRYWVLAENACGLSSASLYNTGFRTITPPQVTGIGASTTTCAAITITWAATSGADSFIVYRDGVRLGATGPLTLFMMDTTAAANSSHSYSVAGKSACGLGAQSSPATGTRTGIPAQVSGVAATNNLCDRIVITWSDVNDETTYVLRRNGQLLANLGANTTSYADTTVSVGTFGYTVRASNPCGSGQVSPTASGVRIALPSQVQGVTASENNCSYVLVTWNDVASEDSFQVRRDGMRMAVLGTNGTSWADYDAVPGTTYSYAVVAYNRCGAGAVSAADNGLRPVILPAVTGLSASSDNCDVVALRWNDLGGEDSYTVYRWYYYYWANIGTTAANETTFTDVNVNPGETFTYYVVGYNLCGWGPACQTVTGKRLPTDVVNFNVQDVGHSTCIQFCGYNNRDCMISVQPLPQGRVPAVSFHPGCNQNGSCNVDCDPTTFVHVIQDWQYDWAYNRYYQVIRGDGCLCATLDSIPSSLRLASPNGGEVLTIQHWATVQWYGAGFVGNVNLDLNRDYPTGQWESLAGNIPNDGNEVIRITDPLSNHCRIRVSAVSDTFSDVSDADFQITASAGRIVVVRPAAPNTPVLMWNAGTVECPLTASATFLIKNIGTSPALVFRPQPLLGGIFSRICLCPDSFTLNAGDTSQCNIRLTYDPVTDGTQLDTLSIRSDASNTAGGFVHVALTGMQISTPQSPQVVIQVQGQDAVLTWQPVSNSVNGCPVYPTAYLVYYSPTGSGPFYYHGFTSSTSYVHPRAVQFAGGMYYQVVAYSGTLSVVEGISQGEEMGVVFGKIGNGK